jgi:5'-methylthioadenosine nucleosidase
MDDTLMNENDASVKDMEAAAIAWVAEITKTPFFAIKVITDLVDGGRLTQDEFMENLSAAASSLQAALPKLLDYVIGKSIADLK